MTTSSGPRTAIRSLIPGRLDRLPWSPFHTRMVLALGVAWILDGFEFTIASNVGEKLSDPTRLGLSTVAVGALGTVYLIGEVVGALLFGHLSDRLGRRRLFAVTLVVYFAGSALTALAPDGALAVPFVYLSRFVAGMGIGGEYGAINSAIDELIPARYRGRVDVIVNGTYWAGAGIAAAIQIPLLSGVLGPGVDWRVAFLIGPVLALGIIALRRNLPESPRWQIVHGLSEQAEASVAHIEREVRASGRALDAVDRSRPLDVVPADDTGYVALVRVLFRAYPGRSTLGATLMITQSFLYNAIFFTYATVLAVFFGVRDTAVFFIPIAIGNLLGPILLGPLFDTIGRRKMISGTYVFSGALLLVCAALFRAGALDATTQTIAWCVVFFFASAGASAAYLTVSEIFPVEVRAKAIAVFFAIAQTVGAVAPLFYGALIDKGAPDRASLFVGYAIGALMMVAGGIVALLLGVDAERKSLEEVAAPLSAVSDRDDAAPPRE